LMRLPAAWRRSSRPICAHSRRWRRKWRGVGL